MVQCGGEKDQAARGPNDRKRHASADIYGFHDQKPASPSAGDPKQGKHPKPMVANQGWGEVFKNKQTFVDMHLG